RLSPAGLHVEEASWSPCGDLIALTVRGRRDPAAQLLILSPTGEPLGEPSGPRPGADVNLYGWSADGTEVLCAASITGPGTHDIGGYDGRSGSWRLRWQVTAHAGASGDAGTESLLLTLDRGGRLRQRVATLAPGATEPAVLLATTSPDESVSAVGFGLDGRT